jgi:hypothetical protein
MPTIFERLDKFDKKEPRYPTRFRDIIDKLFRKCAFDTSVGTEEENTRRVESSPITTSAFSTPQF